MKTVQGAGLLSFAVVFLTSQVAFAWVDIETRCRGDLVSRKHEIKGRNAWALKCGLITEAELQAVELLEGYYWTLVRMNQDSSKAPTSESAPCQPGWVKGVPCRPGCYADSMHMLFGGTYMTLPEAHGAQTPTVTALSQHATRDHLAFVEEPLGAFTRGEEDGTLVSLRTQSGKAITVTTQHPLLDASGMVVPAEALRPGDSVLTVDGAERVTAVQSVAYHGAVWNVRAQREAPKANVHVAEGFLTGSVRYQAEWASDAARLMLRDSLQ